MSHFAPTPYSDVNAVLHALHAGAQEIIGEHWLGLYLYGSLASGDFDPHRSDVDFVVVTRADLPASNIAALEAFHTRLAASGDKWAAKLEGAYVPCATLHRHNPSAAACPTLNEGRFYLAPLGSDWIIQRHILREHGIVLDGPAPTTLIAPVSPDDLRTAVRGILSEWWQPMLATPEWLRGSEYQAYAILTMCRALYVLQQGSIVSKPVAARWAQASLAPRWRPLIEQALTWHSEAPWDNLNETLAFIQHTIEHSPISSSASSPEI